MQRYKVAIQYLGTRYHGWQRNQQATCVAVQDVLEKAIQEFVGPDNHSPCFISSRTDAGVHAIRNVLHVDLCRRARQVGEVLEPHPPETVGRALNAFLKDNDVRVLDVAAVPHEGPEGFHARFCAKERRYVYRLVTGHSAFETNRAWCIGHELDVDAMRTAARVLVGKKLDFSSFRGADCQAKSPVKTLYEIEVVRALRELPQPPAYGEVIHVRVRAPSFLYHQVRNLVGALHAIGVGQLPVSAMQQILDAKDRSAAPRMAPAYGLYLEDVLYDDDLRKEEEEEEKKEEEVDTEKWHPNRREEIKLEK